MYNFVLQKFKFKTKSKGGPVLVPASRALLLSTLLNAVYSRTVKRDDRGSFDPRYTPGTIQDRKPADFNEHFFQLYLAKLDWEITGR
jgi:hypothetical protein